jgi:hypothetical protein
VSRSELLVAIVGLIVVELLHLKWIWLEHWTCPTCHVNNLTCKSPHRQLLKYL